MSKTKDKNKSADNAAQSKEPEIATSSESTLDQITAEIKQHDEAAVSSCWHMGRLLTQARSIVSHGEWEGYLSREFNWTRAHAAKLVRIYESYPQGVPSGVSIDTLDLLRDLDDNTRSSTLYVVEQLGLQLSSVRQLKQKLATDKAEVDKLLTEHKSPLYRQNLKDELRAEVEARVKKEHGDQAEEIDDLERTNKELGDQISKLRAEKIKAEKEAASAVATRKQFEESQKQLLAARAEIEALGKTTPTATAPQIETREVPPADYDDLKQRVAHLQAALEAKNAEPPVAIDESEELTQLRAMLAKSEQQRTAQVDKMERVYFERRTFRAYAIELQKILRAANVAFPECEIALTMQAEAAQSA